MHLVLLTHQETTQQGRRVFVERVFELFQPIHCHSGTLLLCRGFHVLWIHWVQGEEWFPSVLATYLGHLKISGLKKNIRFLLKLHIMLHSWCLFGGGWDFCAFPIQNFTARFLFLSCSNLNRMQRPLKLQMSQVKFDLSPYIYIFIHKLIDLRYDWYDIVFPLW